MDAEQIKVMVGLFVFFWFIILVECIFLGPNPQPWIPQPMEWQEEEKVDANGNTIWKDENHPEMVQVLKPKPYDPKTDSVWAGMPLRDIVYVVMCILMFLGGRFIGYMGFTGSVYGLTDYYHVLPKDVPATEQCVCIAFFGPLILIAYCLYSAKKRLFA